MVPWYSGTTQVAMQRSLALGVDSRASSLRHRRQRVGAAAPEDSAASRKDLIGAHHLVVLMLEDVAVPDVTARISGKRNDAARERLGVHARHILPAELICLRARGRVREPQRAESHELKCGETAAIENLQTHNVKMYRMHIVSEVQESPY